MISKQICEANLKYLRAILPVYKPAGLCSHRLNEALKLDMYYVLEKSGISHGQIFLEHIRDLEPFADGLVTFILGLGRDVKRNFALSNYEYKSVIEFGAERHLNCIDGAVVRRGPTNHITASSIRKVLPQFIGPIDQIGMKSYRVGQDDVRTSYLHHSNPHSQSIDCYNQMPIYLKPSIGGGREPQKYPYRPPPRSVLVEDIRLDCYAEPFAELTITCHGRFVARRFAADLAQRLDTYGSLVRLTRFREGPVTLEDLRVFRLHELSFEHLVERLDRAHEVYKQFNDDMTSKCEELFPKREPSFKVIY